MSSLSTFILPCAEQTLRYADAVVKDIPADQFAHMVVPNLNHPAFNIGHLSMYPDRMLGILGRPELASPKAGWDTLFLAGCPCVEQDGRYPAKDEIVGRFNERMSVLLPAVKEASDEQFSAQNPLEGRMRELFPTVGALITFLLNNHPMMHLGQVSAWRRAMGMPSAM